MNYDEKIIKRLSFENWIWIIFVVISLLSIIGDELIKSSIVTGNKQNDFLAKNLFTLILIISLLIYFYFFLRNYSDMKEHINDEKYQIRLIGSLFIFVGAICLLYFQIKNMSITESLSNI